MPDNIALPETAVKTKAGMLRMEKQRLADEPLLRLDHTLTRLPENQLRCEPLSSQA